MGGERGGRWKRQGEALVPAGDKKMDQLCFDLKRCHSDEERTEEKWCYEGDKQRKAVRTTRGQWS